MATGQPSRPATVQQGTAWHMCALNGKTRFDPTYSLSKEFRHVLHERNPPSLSPPPSWWCEKLWKPRLTSTCNLFPTRRNRTLSSRTISQKFEFNSKNSKTTHVPFQLLECLNFFVQTGNVCCQCFRNNSVSWPIVRPAHSITASSLILHHN